ncbi:MAG: AtpZ/AtpI family protein [Lachnospiraceae bacterium]|nr:AtpZ/AtpI family protein [Lachnospiraceae bacterium]
MSKIIKILSFISQITLIMLIPTCGLFFLGYYLDGKLGTSFLAIVLFFIGAAGGMTGVYKLVRSTFRDDEG